MGMSMTTTMANQERVAKATTEKARRAERVIGSTMTVMSGSEREEKEERVDTTQDAAIITTERAKRVARATTEKARRAARVTTERVERAERVTTERAERAARVDRIMTTTSMVMTTITAKEEREEKEENEAATGAKLIGIRA